jgi:SAF domain
MKLLSPERAADRMVASTVKRRWRWAALAGLVVFLGLAGYAMAVMGASNASNLQPVPVLVAATDIRAGSTITDGMLRVTGIRPDDRSLLTTLVAASDRSSIVGQVAALTVPAGHLIPSDVASSQVHGQLWLASIPVKRMPAGLAAGNHVALLTETQNKLGQPVDFVFMQDVELAHVASNQVDLWLPAKLVPQVEWYADHGGLVLLTMQPGVIQQDLPAATGP